MIDDPLIHAINIVLGDNCSLSLKIDEFLRTDVKDLDVLRLDMIENDDESHMFK